MEMSVSWREPWAEISPPQSGTESSVPPPHRAPLPWRLLGPLLPFLFFPTPELSCRACPQGKGPGSPLCIIDYVPLSLSRLSPLINQCGLNFARFLAESSSTLGSLCPLGLWEVVPAGTCRCYEGGYSPPDPLLPHQQWSYLFSVPPNHCLASSNSTTNFSFSSDCLWSSSASSFSSHTTALSTSS